MDFRRIVLFLVIAVFSGGLTATAAENPAPVTLDMLFQHALSRSEDVNLAAEALYVAEQDKKRALSVLIPRFSAFGDYTRYSEKKTIAGRPVQPAWASDYGLRFDQSVTLNGKELIALDISRTAIKKEHLTLADRQGELLIQVAEVYYQTLQAEKNLEIAAANVHRLHTYKTAVETRLKMGDATQTDLYRARAELSGATAEHVQAANILKLARSSLDRLTGVPATAPLMVPDLSPQNFPEFDPVQLKQEAMAHRTDLKALKLVRTMAADEVRYTKGAWWPRIGIEGVWARPDADPDSLSPIKDQLWAKVSLQFALFDGGLRKAELNQSLSRRRQADLGVSALKKGISVEVDAAYLDFVTRKSTIAALADRLTFARENYKAVTRQSEMGLANSVDVIDANTLLVTTQRAWTEAILAGRLALLKIERATGRLLDHVRHRLPDPSAGQ